MDYQKIYDRLIKKGQHRLLEGYSEKHHIIPTCLGGPNTPENKVVLTPEEHYLAHQLLAKIHPNHYGLLLTCRFMCTDKYGKRINNKEFGWIKRNISKEQSILRKGQTKENNESIARMADTLRDRTKEDYSYLEHHSKVMKGRNKNTHLGIVQMAEKRIGWTKETHAGTAAQAEAITGRTKETHEYLAIMAENKKGQTKENNEGIARMAETLTGRTKETHEYLKRSSEKRIKLSDTERDLIVKLRNEGRSFDYIHKEILNLGFSVSYVTICTSYKKQSGDITDNRSCPK